MIFPPVVREFAAYVSPPRYFSSPDGGEGGDEGNDGGALMYIDKEGQGVLPTL